jgi:hypothetical protein
MEKLRKKVNLRVLLGICFSVRVQGHPQVGTSFAALLLDLEGDLVGGHFGRGQAELRSDLHGEVSVGGTGVKAGRNKIEKF